MRLSNSDIEKIKAEIEERKYVIRPKLIEDLRAAREQGDLSENFEYYVAKRENNRNNSRIRYLEKLVSTASIIEDNNNDNQVGVGDEVEIEYEGQDFVGVYTIVSTFFSDSLNSMVSVESPLGKAIIGKKLGERCFVTVNDETQYYVKIRSIKKGK